VWRDGFTEINNSPRHLEGRHEDGLLAGLLRVDGRPFGDDRRVDERPLCTGDGSVVWLLGHGLT